MKTFTRYKKALEYLGQVRKADDRVKGLETRLENLRMMATDTANHMAEGSVNGGSDKDRTGRIMAEIDEMEGRQKRKPGRYGRRSGQGLAGLAIQLSRKPFICMI